MRIYAEYTERVMQYYLKGGAARTNAEKENLRCVLAALKEFQEHESMLISFYMGDKKKADWKVIREFEKKFAELRGLI